VLFIVALLLVIRSAAAPAATPATSAAPMVGHPGAA
jgi:hypothetical protein